MSNMTGLGRYQKAMEFEAEGLEANQIAYKAGYKNTQAWHAAKHYYKKQTDEMNQRAKGKEDSVSHDQQLAEIKKEELQESPTIDWPTRIHIKNDPVNTLKIDTEIKATGKQFRYRIQNGELLIACLKGDRSIRMNLANVPVLMAELQELLQIGDKA